MEILLNWLWQGAALVLLVALGLRARPAMNAATRERVWWIALVAVAAMPLAHILALETSTDAAATTSAASDATLVIRWTSADRWLAVVAGAWAAWAALSVARVATAWVHLQVAKSEAAPFPCDRESRLCVWTAVRGRGRCARLVVSARVHRAAVLGGRRPLIALAPRTVAELDDQELDRIVIHEYAHVQRRDDAAVLVQRLLAAVIGLHPAVWWIDRALATEREVACDDWVVAHTGARAPYAASLVRLAIPAAGGPWLAPGAVTIPQLRTRVARLMDGVRDTSLARSRRTMIGALALAAAATWVGVETVFVRVDVARVSPPVSVVARVLPPGGTRVEPSREVATATESVIEEALRPTRVRPLPSAATMIPERPSSPMVSAEEEPPLTSDSGGSSQPPAWSSTQTPIEPAFEVLPSILNSDAQEPSSIASLQPNSVLLHEPAVVADSPWQATARAGVAVGRASRDAAVGTAGFFTRLSKSLASRF